MGSVEAGDVWHVCVGGLCEADLPLAMCREHFMLCRRVVDDEAAADREHPPPLTALAAPVIDAQRSLEGGGGGGDWGVIGV